MPSVWARLRRRCHRRKPDDDEPSESRQATFDAFGLLEHVLSYSDIPDLLSASTVDRRWNEAARNDLLWQEVTAALWKGKRGVPQGRGALFRRTRYADAAVERMSRSELISLSPNTTSLYGLDQATLQHHVKLHVCRLALSTTTTSCPIHFRNVWFGSYVASLVDSRRTSMSVHDICSVEGFDLHPEKGIYLTHAVPIVYFERTGLFSWQDMRDEGTHPAEAETWKWLDGTRPQQVQVGKYAPLRVMRDPRDWTWTLENKHVRLVLRHETSECCSSRGGSVLD